MKKRRIRHAHSHDTMLNGRIAGQSFQIRGRDSIVLVLLVAAVGFTVFMLWKTLEWSQTAMLNQHVEILNSVGKALNNR